MCEVRPWILVVAIIVAVGSAGCRSPEREFRPRGSVNLGNFQAMDYFELLRGDLSLHLDGTLDSQVKDPDAWRELIHRHQDVGLSGMSADDRHELLNGAVKAYLQLVTTARIDYETPAGTTTVSESYAIGEGGLYVDLSGRQAAYRGAAVEFGGIPGELDAAISESREFVSTVPGESFLRESWTRSEGSWSCAAGTSDDSYDLARALRLFQLVSLIDAAPKESIEIDGRAVEVLTIEHDDLPPDKYYLDAATLWPIGWSQTTPLPDGSYVVVSGELTEVNGLGAIERPADECT